MRSNLKSIRLWVPWTSLVVQWLRLHAPREGGFDLWLGKSPHAMCHGQKEKEKSSARGGTLSWAWHRYFPNTWNRTWQTLVLRGFPSSSVGKESACNAGYTGDRGSVAGLGRSPGGGKWQLTPVTLPGRSHGQRSLVGYSPKGRKGVHTTEQPPRQIKVLNKYCCMNGDEAPNLNEDTSQTQSSYPPC